MLFLNTRQIKEITKKLKNQFGFDGKLDFAFLKSTKNKIYIVTKDIGNIEYEELRMDTMGNYFGTDEDDIRLSIEGSQLVGPFSTKNILDLNEEQMQQWFHGEDVEIQGVNGFHIIKYKSDYLVCYKGIQMIY